jgi:starch phosphorylase
VKKDCKRKLQEWVKTNTGYYIPLDAMHEYKRQLMNILYIIHRYLSIKDTPANQRKEKWEPRVCMIGGKAAPAYTAAKNIIKLIGNVAAKINNDPEIGDLLKVIFLPNYCVSAA